MRAQSLLWVSAFVSLALAAGTLENPRALSQPHTASSGLRVPSASSQVGGDFVGSDTAKAMLVRMRQQRGLDAEAEISSLLIRTTRKAGSALPEYETLRLLGPDRFQRVGRHVYTVVGDAYWQRPTPGKTALEVAERNTRARFAEVALLFLLRGAPSVSPLAVHASRRGQDQIIEVTGGADFKRVLVMDSDGVLRAIEEVGQLTQGGAGTTVTRRLAIEEYQSVAGILFPSRLTERIAEYSAAIEVTEILLNEQVFPHDFDPSPDK